MPRANQDAEIKNAKELLDSADLFGGNPEVVRNPQKFYEAARTLGPITQEPHHGIYLATRYKDIQEIEKRHQDFSAAPAALGPFVKGQVPERPSESECPFGKADLDKELDAWRVETKVNLIPVLTLDPPIHTEYRNLINRLFTPERKEHVTPRLRELAQELIGSFIEDGEVEWVAGYSGPYTYFVMNEVMDFPRADEDLIRRRFLERHKTDSVSARQAVIDGTRNAQQENQLGMSDERFLEYLTQRRANPRDDVLSEIATARLANGTLPELHELVGISSVMYGAGQVTTTDLIGNAMLFLARDQELQARLADHPEEIERFVEEMLRIESPVQGLFRYARRDTEVNGTPIPAGAIIWMIYGAGNRDPEQFEDPDEFDPLRENAYQNISFGAGRHFCPGQPLAKLEAKITFEEVLKRLKNIRLKRDTEVKFHDWFVVHGPNQLFIEFDTIDE
jgi:cytochrome P450